MYVCNGKCRADGPSPILKIVAARTVSPYCLDVVFNNGEERLFDGRLLLDGEVFAPLKDPAVFDAYRLDYETLTWLDGEVDIAPEYVYEHGTRTSLGQCGQNLPQLKSICENGRVEMENG